MAETEKQPSGQVLIQVPLNNAARLGTAVRDARRAQKLTQAELAKRTGVSRQWIVTLENGAPRAEISRVLEVFYALNLALYLGEPLPTGPVTYQDLDLP